MNAGLHDFNQPQTGDDVVRTLPHAVGPEKSVLSSALYEPHEFIPRLIEMGFTPETFYLPQHSTLYGELLRRFHAGEEIELTGLVQSLLDRGLLDRVGGPATLTDIYGYSCGGTYFQGHAVHVLEKHVLRATIQACTEAIADAYDGPERAQDVVDALESKLTTVREDSTTHNSLRRAGDDIDAIVQEFGNILHGRPTSARGITTGFEDIDRMTGGLKPGEMFVVAARPSVGKTSLMMNIAEHIAIDLAEHSLIFSMEMPRLQVVSRLAYSRAKLPLSAILNGDLKPTKSDLLRFQNAALAIKAAPLFIDDRAGLSIQEIRAKARRLHRKKPVKFIGVDYLQLAHSHSKQAKNSREREVGEVSAGLKELAKELGCAVLVLAQLNRGPENRTGKSRGVPRMSDLRESGTIEQDADLIGLLHRADYSCDTAEEREENQGRAELIIAKNRNGATGHCPLTFIADLMRFETGIPAPEPAFRPSAPKSRYDD